MKSPLINIFVLAFIFCSFTTPEKTIIDSNYTFEEALKGIDIPSDIKKELILVDVIYYSFDNKLHSGQLLINKSVKNDIEEIFKIIVRQKFLVKKVIPAAYYNWDDNKSMSDNNTTSFNYRKVQGTKVLSAHSYGKAIDINPFKNPMIKNGKSDPPGSSYKPGTPGTLSKESIIVKEFTKRGWEWGGMWRSLKDYQHFEKP